LPFALVRANRSLRSGAGQNARLPNPICEIAICFYAFTVASQCAYPKRIRRYGVKAESPPRKTCAQVRGLREGSNNANGEARLSHISVSTRSVACE